MKRLKQDYTAHLIPLHPHTSQNGDGRSLTHSNPESHTLIPSATMALAVSDVNQNQSYPLLFLSEGGYCVGVFC